MIPDWRWFLWRVRASRFRSLFTSHQALGRTAEDLAHDHLRRLGYQILDRNWFDRHSLSEIDLVARHEGRLVFIEVKARTSDDLAAPERAIDLVKRAALGRGISAYARRVRAHAEDLRFDVVTVIFDNPPRITLHAGEPLFPRRARNAVS